MANLKDGSRVYGSLIVDNAVVAGAGAGYQNMVLFTTGTSAVYNFPTALRVPGAKFKLTIIGGGGGGSGTVSQTGLLAALSCGGGGGSGAVCIAVVTVVSGFYSFGYTVGTGGTAGAAGGAGGGGNNSFVFYNNTTFLALGGTNGLPITIGGGTGAPGGTASGGTLNLPGNPGRCASVVLNVGGNANPPFGGTTPLGYGRYGTSIGAAASGAGNAGLGYGSGGGGGKNNNGTAAVAGGAGAPGIIILEY